MIAQGTFHLWTLGSGRAMVAGSVWSETGIVLPEKVMSQSIVIAALGSGELGARVKSQLSEHRAPRSWLFGLGNSAANSWQVL